MVPFIEHRLDFAAFFDSVIVRSCRGSRRWAVAESISQIAGIATDGVFHDQSDDRPIRFVQPHDQSVLTALAAFNCGRRAIYEISDRSWSSCLACQRIGPILVLSSRKSVLKVQCRIGLIRRSRSLIRSRHFASSRPDNLPWAGSLCRQPAVPCGRRTNLPLNHLAAIRQDKLLLSIRQWPYKPPVAVELSLVTEEVVFRGWLRFMKIHCWSFCVQLISESQ